MASQPSQTPQTSQTSQQSQPSQTPWTTQTSESAHSVSQQAQAIVHDLFIEPTKRPVDYLKRAGVAAWYPMRGIWFFANNRDYWPLFFSRLLPLSIISFIVYALLFTFAFLPQFAFLAIFHGIGAWINALVLVLGEGYIIIQALFEGFFIDEYRVDAFDATLIKRGLQDLIAPHRILFPDAPNAVKMLGKPTSSAIYTPWSIVQIVELVIYLPLNLIPFVGTPAFIIITGARLGKLAHYRWYQLRGLTRAERKLEIKSRTWEYTWFGTVAMLLELIPVLSLFFLLTTTVGSALWVADMEEAKRERDVRGLVGEPLPPQEYRDDPV